MSTPINILIVEDSVADALLLVDELKTAGFNPKWKRVETEADYRAGLEDSLDLIVSDYTMPQFGGLRAVDLLAERGLDTPFILVSGTMGEEKAVEAMKHGVTDYLLKDRIGRLGNAVERALELKRLRDEHKRAEDSLRESEDRYRSLVEESPDVIGIYQDDKLIFVNSTGARLFGSKTKAELLGRKTDQVIHPDDFQAAMDRIRRRLAGETGIYPAEVRYLLLDGTAVPVEVSATPITFGGKPAVQFIARDITARKQGDARLRNSEALYHSLVENLPQHVFRKNPAGGFTFGNGPFCRSLGKPLAEILGKTDLDFCPAELAAKYQQDDQRVIQTGQSFEGEEEHRQADGKTIFVNVIKTPLRDAAGTIIGVQGISWDITARKQREAQLRLQGAALESAANSILITDRAGTILWVNPAFTRMTGYAAEEIIGQHPRLLKSGEHDAAFYKDLWDTILAGRVWRSEMINRHKNGHLYTEESTITPVRDERGEITHFIGIKQDVTERKWNENRLLAFSSLGQRLGAAKTAPEAADIIMDVADHLFGWDACTLDLYSPEKDRVHHVLCRDTINGRRVTVPPAYDDTPPSPRARRVIESGAQLILREEPYAMADSIPFGDTSRPSASLMLVPIRDGAKVTGLLSIQSYKPKAYSARDLDALQSLTDHCGGALDRIQAAESLQESEDRFRLITETIDEVFWMADVEIHQMLYVSPAYERVWRRSRESLYGNPRSFLDALHDHDRERVSALQRQKTGQPFDCEYRIVWPDGSIRWIWDRGFPVNNPKGPVAYYVGIAQDITGRKQAELRVVAFSSLGQKLSSAKTAEEAGDIIMDVADQLFGWDACTLDLYSSQEDQIYQVLNRDTIDGQRITAPPAYNDAAPSPLARRVLEQGAQLILREEPYAMSDGIPFGDTSRPSASLLFVPIRDGPKITGLLSIQSYKNKAYTAQDLDTLQALTDHCGGALNRIQAAEALKDSEQRYRTLIEQARDAVFTLAPDQTITSLSPAFETITGFPCSEWIGGVFPPLLHPDDLPKAIEVFRRVMRNEKPPQFELRVRTKSGGFVTLEFTVTQQFHAGTLSGVMGIGRDVTGRKQLEEQLRQSQKMEAIGQLAAGVAHDFNNMLAVIHGNAELVLMDAERLDAETRESINQITSATERAASLTRQLLAFGRKQTMQLQQLDLNEVISNLTKMLNRVIGENIRLQCTYAKRLPVVEADVGMMEQVLLNLVVNARDAMRHGGRLLIKTEPIMLDEAYAEIHPEARAGEFSCLSVSDTGTGIPAEYLPRIFEPFYTTKEVGKGTGLGLATVYGIVKQHQGWIEVATQLGAGTTFKIFLPAIPAPATEAAAPPATPALRGGTETILLVEDDSAFRLLTQRTLEAFDYRVIEAASGRAAMEIWRSRSAEIDLLLTDMVMPDNITGRELAEVFFVERPALKTIFMSGYSMDAVGKGTEFIRRTKSYFLQKPFSSSVLLQTVRQCLDEE